MKLFIGLVLDQKTKSKLEQIARGLHPHLVKGNWTLTSNFHLTLPFIGEVTKDRLEVIEACCDHVSKMQKPFPITFDHFSSFPKHHKEILWIGTDPRSLVPLGSLYSQLEETLIKSGILLSPSSFIPHVTLGRGIILDRPSLSLFEQIPFEPLTYFVSGFSIMESKRIDDVLRYVPIHDYVFCNDTSDDLQF